jgi:hypothetical protein
MLDETNVYKLELEMKIHFALLEEYAFWAVNICLV